MFFASIGFDAFRLHQQAGKHILALPARDADWPHREYDSYRNWRLQARSCCLCRKGSCDELPRAEGEDRKLKLERMRRCQ
jgi:hypothetical protein